MSMNVSSRVRFRPFDVLLPDDLNNVEKVLVDHYYFGFEGKIFKL